MAATYYLDPWVNVRTIVWEQEARTATDVKEDELESCSPHVCWKMVGRVTKRIVETHAGQEAVLLRLEVT